MEKTIFDKLLFFVGIFVGVISIASSVISSMHYAPKNIFIDNSNNLVMETKLGTPKYIPLDEIEIKECPDTLLINMVRTNGASHGKVHYGDFKKRDTGRKFFLFLTGKKNKVCFEYEEIMYVVDAFR